LDILQIAEENFLVTFALIIGIGGLQGAILGRGIRNRFPRLKRHARAVSIFLLILFSLSAIINVIKFTDPEKISFSDLFIPTTTEEFLSILINVLGLNAGLVAVMATFVSVTLILFLRFVEIHPIAKYFIFSLGFIVLIIAVIGKITDFAPNPFQIIAYSFYQSGITIGIFLVTRRNIDFKAELE